MREAEVVVHDTISNAVLLGRVDMEVAFTAMASLDVSEIIGELILLIEDISLDDFTQVTQTTRVALPPDAVRAVAAIQDADSEKMMAALRSDTLEEVVTHLFSIAVAQRISEGR